MIRLPSPWSATVLLALLGLSTCKQASDFEVCENGCVDCDEPCACPDGECAQVSPVGWDGPVLLWAGPATEAQLCPPQSINVVYEGHADLHATSRCPRCECGLPACEPPAGLVASTVNACPNDGGVRISYDAPDGWDGSCVSPGIILAGEFTSAAISSTTVRPCEIIARPPVPAQGTIEWGVFARACKPAGLPASCNDSTEGCSSISDPPPPGFAQCVFKEGEPSQCPVGYPERRVFFSGVEGGFGCTACQCGPPEGSECRVQFAAYSDTTCTVKYFGFAISLSNHPCITGMVPRDIASMSATFVTDIPGVCAPSGGEPFGEVAPADPSTFCCRLAGD